jgi:site-specific recombinase XerC
MKDLVYQLVCLTNRNHDGSFATRSNRYDILTMCAEQLLEERRYKKLTLYGLEAEHAWHLVTRWKATGITHPTIRNRLACLRWWAEKVNKAGVIPPNTAFGLTPRSQIARVSRAQDLAPEQLAQIPDPYVRMSLRLQRAFGLRREEAMKMRPHEADQGTRLVLRGSWCKGNRPREVPIRTDAQRALLDEAKALVPGRHASLIPTRQYVQQKHRYEYRVRQAGLEAPHGLRHAYAQERYRELAGHLAPVAGGPTKASMTPAQVEADTQARLILTRELGHGRVQITRNYLG